MSKRNRLAFPLTLIVFVVCFAALVAGLYHRWPGVMNERQPLPDTMPGGVTVKG